MPNNNTLIQLKRSDKDFAELSTEPIQYGEPVFFGPDDDSKNICLAIGNSVDDSTIATATFFSGVTNSDLIGKEVYVDANNIAITKEEETVKAAKLSPTLASTSSDTNYYLVSFDITDGTAYYHNMTNGIYIKRGVLTGGAWNDYAEGRICSESKPGMVVCEKGDGTLEKSSTKLQALPYVISDTYGVIVGHKEDTTQPVAVAGRVLVQVDCKVEVGDVLCASDNGFATKMTRQEIANFPDRILGIVSEIPTYEEWNDVSVNDRVWIKLK